MPFVKPGGLFIALKSANSEEEIKEAEETIKILGGKIKEVIDYKINENGRKLVIIEKVSQTPKKYPRNPNQIKKIIIKI